MATYIIRIARRAGIVILFTLAVILGLSSGVFFAYAGDLPRISALDDYAPSTISRVYGARGEIIGEFAIQRREVIPYEGISPKLKQAILAAEDATFEQRSEEHTSELQSLAYLVCRLLLEKKKKKKKKTIVIS